jgi:Protein of unknown function (DUF3999)
MRFAVASGLALAFVAVAASSAADDRMPAPVDYAYGWTIRQAAPSGFHEFDLPLEVYRSVADPALRDIGVYDARGEPVPRLIGAPLEPAAAPDETVEESLLPVLASPGTRVADMRVALEQSGDGTSVRIESVANADGVALQQALVAYIADLGEKTARLRALEFDWPREIEPVIAHLTIEGSDDLDRWSLLGSGTVAGLSQDDARIERRRIELQSPAIRYLRISWSRVPDGWRLTRLVARYSRSPQPAPRRTETLWPTGRDPDDGGWLYDLGGAPQVDRIGLELPANNELLRVNVQAWEPSGQYWRPVHEGLFYRLQREGSVLESEPVAIAPLRASRWKLVIERGSAASRLGLVLGWRPDRLLFLAQGEGPWQLVAGSAQDAQAGFPQARYADPDMRGILKNAGPVGVATLAARQTLGGETRLQPPRSPEWRRWLLWLGLVVGVLLVAGMALRLLRQPARPA